MAYHDEDLIDLDVFLSHGSDSQLPIHSIDAADQRPSAYQYVQVQNSADRPIETPGPDQDIEDKPLPEPPEALSASRTRNVSPSTHPERVGQRFDWANPLLMTVSLLVGVSLAVAHHFYYNWLDGRVVGDSNKQQWALR